VWIAKLDSSGSLGPACTLPNGISIITGDTNATAIASTAIPVDSAFTAEDVSYSVIDAYGSEKQICMEGIPYLLPHKPVIDDSSSSTPNGIIEPDESVDLIGAMENVGSVTAASVSGVLSTLDPITINDYSVSYPDIASGATVNSIDHYNLTAPAANRPSTHWDFTVTESPSCSGCPPNSNNFFYHVGNSFSDVPPSQPFYSYIETMLHADITAGCTSQTYCPSAAVQQDAQLRTFTIVQLTM
jgi:hypothetical protein